MRCWLTLPTTTSAQSGVHTFTSSMRVHTMRMTATHGLPVFRGTTPHRVPQLRVVCSIMQTITMQTQRSRMAPVSSLPTRHRPRLTCVSILTQPTAVPTAAAAPTSLTFRASTTTEPLLLLGRIGMQAELDLTTMALVRTPRRINLHLEVTHAMKSKLRIQRPCDQVSRTRIWPPN